MTQKICTDPYERMGALAPKVCFQAINKSSLKEFLSNAEGKSYNELVQGLVDRLRGEMEKAFSNDPVVQELQPKLISDNESVHSLAQHYSSCPKSMDYIKQRLKEFDYQPPPPSSNHDWCVLC